MLDISPACSANCLFSDKNPLLLSLMSQRWTNLWIYSVESVVSKDQDNHLYSWSGTT